ncbi:hypothetical protein KR49_12585 [Synechococcus sp. KORDI-49]|jgi:hypothetical protein|nr:hypothetical protein KR49_12585 [Synechococcus sp. KORDI-49]
MATDPAFHHQDDSSSSSESEDPFSPGPPVTALIGLIIALSSVGAPLAAVITDRSSGWSGLTPTAQQRDGSPPPPPFSLTRAGQSAGGDPGW